MYTNKPNAGDTVDIPGESLVLVRLLEHGDASVRLLALTTTACAHARGGRFNTHKRTHRYYRTVCYTGSFKCKAK